MSRQGRRLTATANKSADPPVKQQTLNEVFGVLIESASARSAFRAACRTASGGKPPTRLWRYAGQTVAANTRGEARAKVKRLLHLTRLPAGETAWELVGLRKGRAG